MFDDFTATVCVEEIYPSDQDPSLYPWDDEPVARKPSIGQRLRATFWLVFGCVAPCILPPSLYYIIMNDPTWMIRQTLILVPIVAAETLACPIAVHNIWRDIRAGRWYY